MFKKKSTTRKICIVAAAVVIAIIGAGIIILPGFLPEDEIKQKAVQAIEDSLHVDTEVGSISFHWPNRLHAMYLTLQDKTADDNARTRFEDIDCTFELIPVLSERFVVKKIAIREINYENRLLVRDFITDEFSFQDDVLFLHAHCTVNNGPTELKGSIDFSAKKPLFDLWLDARDVSVDQDMPFLESLPVFLTESGEMGGILSARGTIRGKGFDKKSIRKKLDVDMNLSIVQGYVKGNKIFSYVSEVTGIKDTYSFDSMETEVRVKKGVVYTSKLNVDSQVIQLYATGRAEFGGKIAYDAEVKVNKAYIGKGIEKYARMLLGDNALPIEIRGTVDDPEISVKISTDNVEQLLQGLVNEFLSPSKKK